MAIGTPLALGATNAAAGALTLALTTTATAPAGGLIVVVCSGSQGSNITGCTDSAGNTYTANGLPATFSNGTGKSHLFWSFNAIVLPSGGTITVTFAVVTPIKNMAAVSVTGCAAANLIGAGALGTSTAPTIGTGVLGWPNEIVFGLTQVSAGSADGFTEASGFTSLASSLNSDGLHWAYQVTTANASLTYAPTLGTSRTWGVNTLTFSGAVASPFSLAPRFSYLEF